MRTLTSMAGVAMLTCGLLSGPPALAIPVTYSFTGHVTSVDPLLAGSFSVNDPLSVQFTADTSALVGQLIIPGLYYEYAYAFSAFSITFGAHNFSLPYISKDFSAVGVATSYPDPFTSGVNDNVFAISEFYSESGSPPIAGPSGYLLRDAFLSLFDTTATALASVALPQSLSLASFNETFAGLDFCAVQATDCQGGAGNFQEVVGTLTALTVSTGGASVPEPGTLGLFGLALAGMTMAKRNRKSRLKPWLIRRSL